MRRNDARVLTTHAGSLARPADVLDALGDRLRSHVTDPRRVSAQLRGAVHDVVTGQCACGIDVVNDGEYSKVNFAEYVADRFDGLGGETSEPVFARRRRDFPDYYGDPRYFSNPADQQIGAPARHRACVGPIVHRDKDAVRADIANLLDATEQLDVADVFMASPSPGILAMRIANEHYASEEEYLFALADALHEEYVAITAAGVILQVDSPDLPLSWDVEFGAERLVDYRRTAAMRVEALNHALRGIPEDLVRCHVCWGNYEGPHTLDIDLAEIIDVVLRVRAQAYSIEAANPRHEHEWQVWRDVRLPDGKIVIPGVIDSTTNFVEHPEVVAERIVRFADTVGKENVIAGTDCGFGTFPRAAPRVHPQVAWAKLAALAEGAAIASRHLWT